jgi:hypothetical protein
VLEIWHEMSNEMVFKIESEERARQAPENAITVVYRRMEDGLDDLWLIQCKYHG